MAISMAACGTSNSSETTTTKTEAPSSTTEAESSETETESSETEAPVEVVDLNVAYKPNYASLWSVLTTIDKVYFE
jgi:hypothetical protein